MVNAGDIVVCQITTQNTFSTTPDDVVQSAASILASEGYGVVGSSLSTPGVLDAILGMGYQTFQATLSVQVPTAFADPTDVLSIVENAFYQVTGSYPTSATVPSTQTPGSAPVATGLPSLSATGVGGSQSGITSQVAGAGSGLLSGLGSLGNTALIGIVVLVIALLFIVGYSPNTRHVAGAFA